MALVAAVLILRRSVSQDQPATDNDIPLHPSSDQDSGPSRGDAELLAGNELADGRLAPPVGEGAIELVDVVLGVARPDAGEDVDGSAPNSRGGPELPDAPAR
ncbi:predicted protein [Streptomyces filamentosus NRRL 15998]|uniref:Predicted protein n=1 Tax=Streptomyces filamentosus NRRL 15998 TaxID=457431 RepID=D6ATU5_STRFL|nr:predicted protein [Streptomyces filamentosus NRRL 15998]